MSATLTGLLTGVLSIGLCVYLFFALIKPEKF
jgi:K+-transporting ATPase KdpF subunit